MCVTCALDSEATLPDLMLTGSQPAQQQVKQESAGQQQQQQRLSFRGVPRSDSSGGNYFLLTQVCGSHAVLFGFAALLRCMASAVVMRRHACQLPQSRLPPCVCLRRRTGHRLARACLLCTRCTRCTPSSPRGSELLLLLGCCCLCVTRGWALTLACLRTKPLCTLDICA
jgi:hypothetical protein